MYKYLHNRNCETSICISHMHIRQTVTMSGTLERDLQRTMQSVLIAVHLESSTIHTKLAKLKSLGTLMTAPHIDSKDVQWETSLEN